MTASERGILLLCCPMGDPAARPLTLAQFRELSKRASAIGIGTGDPLADIRPKDLTRLGYSKGEAEHIVGLLGREARLEQYLARGRAYGFEPVTRLSDGYPSRLAMQRGMSCPPLFFFAGNLALFRRPCISVVGSRKLREAGERFARRAGILAAKEGYTLVTGGAAGADQTAQTACLEAGGSVIAFRPDDLRHHAAMAGEHCLICSESGYDLPFSSARALTRNAYIHMLGEKTLVAQTDYGTGGTWNGAMENLKHGWSPLFVLADGSQGASALAERGAVPVQSLESLRILSSPQECIFSK